MIQNHALGKTVILIHKYFMLKLL